MSNAKTIKRYSNRKLYDTERSCYVTLDDISVMITAGEEVRVVNNSDGEDLTSVTLAQIIYESEKKKNFMPLGLLRNLIQQKGEAFGQIYRDGIEQLKDTAQDRAHELRTTAEKISRPARDLVDQSQKALDNLQLQVEKRLKGGVNVVGRELQQLRDRLSELEDRIGKG